MTIITRCPICGSEAHTDEYMGETIYFCGNRKCPICPDNPEMAWTLEQWNSFNGWRDKPESGWDVDGLPKSGEPVEICYHGIYQYRTYQFDGSFFVLFADEGDCIEAGKITAWKYTCAPPEVE